MSTKPKHVEIIDVKLPINSDLNFTKTAMSESAIKHKSRDVNQVGS